MPFYQYFNGSVFPLETPLFESNDLGLLRGYALFDYFRTYNGVPFRWDDYWGRFENSAALLHLKMPLSQQQAAEILGNLFTRSKERDVAFRLLLTGGYAPDSIDGTLPNLLIRTEPLMPENLAGKMNGIKVLPYEYVRDLPEIKSTSYIHLMLMTDEMKKQQATDLLYHKNDVISELTRSNLFIIKGKALITPDKNVLHGITRRVVMELAAPYFDIHQRPVSLEEMLYADEVFTTSSTKGVMPVVQVGDKFIKNGVPGKHTLYLQSLFNNLIINWGK